MLFSLSSDQCVCIMPCLNSLERNWGIPGRFVVYYERPCMITALRSLRRQGSGLREPWKQAKKGLSLPETAAVSLSAGECRVASRICDRRLSSVHFGKKRRLQRGRYKLRTLMLHNLYQSQITLFVLRALYQ